MNVFRKSILPVRHHYSNNKRIDDILLDMDPGWQVARLVLSMHVLILFIKQLGITFSITRLTFNGSTIHTVVSLNSACALWLFRTDTVKARWHVLCQSSTTVQLSICMSCMSWVHVVFFVSWPLASVAYMPRTGAYTCTSKIIWIVELRMTLNKENFRNRSVCFV